METKEIIGLVVMGLLLLPIFSVMIAIAIKTIIGIFKDDWL